MDPAIDNLSYADLVALLREENRPPGGARSVWGLARAAGVHAASRVLEIGCTTGFTSITLATLTGCRVDGIDTNVASVDEARRRAVTLPPEYAQRITFAEGDALDLPFDDGSFDLVVCGGATSFIAEQAAAINEFQRVLRPFGFVSVTNLCYESPPPDEVTSALHDVLGFRPRSWDASRWLALFTSNGLQVLDCVVKRLMPRPPEAIDKHIEALFKQEHLQCLDSDARSALIDRWSHAMHTFNENHRYLSYVQALLYEPPSVCASQTELFLEAGAWDPVAQRLVETSWDG
jgi:ubiquinone/menaquinone biosynthesis C-methylase UbiE